MNKSEQSSHFPKVVYLTRAAPDACFLAHTLAKSPEMKLVGIIMENRSAGQVQLIKSKISRNLKASKWLALIELLLSLPIFFIFDRWHFFRLKYSFFRFKPMLFPKNVPLFSVQNHNSEECRKLLKVLGADCGFVYGTRILSKNTFEVPKFGSVNLHMGILPYFRGAKSEFWALLNRDYSSIGSTIHKVRSGVDDGEIIFQKTIKATVECKPVNLRIENVRTIAPDIGFALKTYCEEGIATQKQNIKKFPAYSTPSLKSVFKLFIRRNLAIYFNQAELRK